MQEASAGERRYWSPTEVMQMVGVSRSTVFAALWSGKLLGYRVGKRWLIPVEAVDLWIRGGDERAA